MIHFHARSRSEIFDTVLLKHGHETEGYHELFYIDKIRQKLPSEHSFHNVLNSSSNKAQRVYYAGAQEIASEGLAELPKILREADEDLLKPVQRVCVIENIHPEWIEALGTSWNIPPDFFIGHAENILGGKLWDSVMSTPLYASASVMTGSDHQHCHVDGVLPHLKGQGQPFNRFPRRSEWNASHGWQRNTMVSYRRVAEDFYLFLVDSRLDMQTEADLSSASRLTSSRLNLCVPYSTTRGGLPIPELYENVGFSMFEIIQSFLSHDWQWSILFHDREWAVSPAVFLHFLAASTWRSNLRFLDRDIKRIAFRDIRRPTQHINDMLHDRRHDLDTLQIKVALAKDHIPTEVTEHELCQPGGSYKTPKETFQEVYDASQSLERFLMDTFQLLMSSISVLDAQTSIQQGQRSTQLTLLATLYVPLSFVTGIFGMNVREINDSGHPIWQFVVTQVVVLVVTGLLLWIVHALLKSEQGAEKSAKDEKTKSTV